MKPYAEKRLYHVTCNANMPVVQDPENNKFYGECDKCGVHTIGFFCYKNLIKAYEGYPDSAVIIVIPFDMDTIPT